MQFFLMLYLATKPDIMLIDEITSVLDVYAREYFLLELKHFIKAGGTILFTTNIISEVQNYTDHLIFIHEKGIKINDPIEKIKTDFVKIRKTADNSHAIFDHEKCCWAGENTDGSTSYIVPKDIFEEFQLDDSFIDRRKIVLSDIFIYYFNFDIEEEDHEIAS